MKRRFQKQWLTVFMTVFAGSWACPIGASIPKDVLVLGQSQENINSLDPGVCFGDPWGGFVRNFYANLTRLAVKNGKFSVEPDAAEKWEMASDGKTWTFHLRKGIVFDNGDPMKAEDVVYSLRRAIKLQKTPAWLFTEVLGLTEDSVTAVDERTVRLVTKGVPSNIVLTNLSATLGGILNSRIVKDHEVSGDMGMGWLNDHSAGAGAYSLKGWKRNESVMFVANKSYWQGEPKIKTIISKNVPEAADRLLQVKKGDIDVAFGLLPDQVKSIETDPGNLQIVKSPAQSIEYVGVNASWGPFKDVRVRQAIKYAIDYNAIINQARQGMAIPNQQFIAKGYFGYKERNPFKLNVEKAKSLMKEAGQANGFEVELVTNTNEVRKLEAQIVQENLAKIGIKTTINIMPAAQMYKKMREQGIKMIVAGWGVDFLETDALATPFTNHKAKQLAWRMAWLDEKASQLAEAAAKEVNEKKRLKMYNELTEYWQKNGPFATILQPMECWVASRSVKGLAEAFGGYSLHVDLAKIQK